jgi:hypothetical protein
MADFCNKCIVEFFGDEISPDIDVYQIYEKLEPGYAEFGHLCEGCGIVAVARDEAGKLVVLREPNADTDIWETY